MRKETGKKDYTEMNLDFPADAKRLVALPARIIFRIDRTVRDRRVVFGIARCLAQPGTDPEISLGPPISSRQDPTHRIITSESPAAIPSSQHLVPRHFLSSNAPHPSHTSPSPSLHHTADNLQPHHRDWGCTPSEHRTEIVLVPAQGNTVQQEGEEVRYRL